MRCEMRSKCHNWDFP